MPALEVWLASWNRMTSIYHQSCYWCFIVQEIEDGTYNGDWWDGTFCKGHVRTWRGWITSIYCLWKNQHIVQYSHVASNHHPNVTAVAKHLANGNSTNEQILVTYAENSAQPAYEYFKAKFDNNLSNALQFLKQQGTSLLKDFWTQTYN